MPRSCCRLSAALLLADVWQSGSRTQGFLPAGAKPMDARAPKARGRETLQHITTANLAELLPSEQGPPDVGRLPHRAVTGARNIAEDPVETQRRWVSICASRREQHHESHANNGRVNCMRSASAMPSCDREDAC